MCKPEQASKESDPQSKDAKDEVIGTNPKRQMSKNKSQQKDVASMSSSVLSGVLHGVVWNVFAANLPFFLSGADVYHKLYQHASFRYDASISLFDNTVLTYGTDYAIAAMTLAIAFWILRTSNRAETQVAAKLSKLSALMLVLYATSTFAGGLGHHFFLTVDSRNTNLFRVLWTVCVGGVYLAPMTMGMIGNECLRIFQPRSNCPPLLKSMPLLTDTYWCLYGSIGTIAWILGFSSFQRPVCDIFLAGITQTPCTFYFMAFLYLVEHPVITNAVKIRGLVGFIMNAFLLPLYPVLVFNFGLSLGVANAIQHANLFVAWGMQGMTMQTVVKALVEEETEASRSPSSSDQKTKDQ